MSTKSKTFNKLWHESHGFKKRCAFASISVTPQLAAELLELNTANRPKMTRKDLDAAMTKDQWIENGDSIRISTEGVILDGQHRLDAIIKHGLTIKQDIATGIIPEAFKTIDIGRIRTKAHTLATMGYKNSTALASLVSSLISYEVNNDFQKNTAKQILYNNDVASYMESLPEHELESIENSLAKGWRLYQKNNFLSTPSWAFVDVVLGKIDREAADKFLDLCATGDGVNSRDKTSGIYQLRLKLNSSLFNKKGVFVSVAPRVALVFRAWNLYRTNKVVKQLSWDDRQDFPIPQ